MDILAALKQEEAKIEKQVSAAQQQLDTGARGRSKTRCRGNLQLCGRRQNGTHARACCGPWLFSLHPEFHWGLVESHRLYLSLAGRHAIGLHKKEGCSDSCQQGRRGTRGRI